MANPAASRDFFGPSIIPIFRKVSSMITMALLLFFVNLLRHLPCFIYKLYLKYKFGSHRAIWGNAMRTIKPAIIIPTKGTIDL